MTPPHPQGWKHTAGDTSALMPQVLDKKQGQHYDDNLIMILILQLAFIFSSKTFAHMGACLTHITSPDCSYFLPNWTLIFSDVGAYIDLNCYRNVMLLLIIRNNDQTLLR